MDETSAGDQAERFISELKAEVEALKKIIDNEDHTLNVAYGNLKKEYWALHEENMRLLREVERLETDGGKYERRHIVNEIEGMKRFIYKHSLEAHNVLDDVIAMIKSREQL